mmetsp:Transcript_33265/g.61268  ORF Transcript_33265/g.61268 Transcript_33265/m.61268 type:complete len:242 (-) Transcript_33265:3444-4169(-)
MNPDQKSLLDPSSLFEKTTTRSATCCNGPDPRRRRSLSRSLRNLCTKWATSLARYRDTAVASAARSRTSPHFICSFPLSLEPPNDFTDTAKEGRGTHTTANSWGSSSYVSPLSPSRTASFPTDWSSNTATSTNGPVIAAAAGAAAARGPFFAAASCSFFVRLASALCSRLSWVLLFLPEEVLQWLLETFVFSLRVVAVATAEASGFSKDEFIADRKALTTAGVLSRKRAPSAFMFGANVCS